MGRAPKVFLLCGLAAAMGGFIWKQRTRPPQATEESAEVFGPRPASTPENPTFVGPPALASSTGLDARGRELLPDQRIGVEGERERVAAYKQRKKAERNEREARWGFKVGAPFISGAGEKLHLMEALEAVKSDSRTQSPGAVVKRLGRWEIRERRPEAEAADDTRLSHYDPENPPVVRNEESQRVGVATGQFIVKYRDGIDSRTIAAAHALKVTGEQEGARRVFLGANAGQDLVATLAALRADAAIEEAALDVIYDRARPK